MKNFLLLVLGIFSCTCACADEITGKITSSPIFSFLDGRIDINNHRYQSFIIALALLEARGAKVMVETGTARWGDKNFHGDGGSTIIFGDWAREHNALLYTVDISLEALDRAKAAIGKSIDSVKFIHSDSIKYLKNFDQQIDFLYLDSFDYEYNDPLPSQNHHLNELIAALPSLKKSSVIMIDDCTLENGGKGKLVIKHLLSLGWRIVCDSYQVILVQDSSIGSSRV